MDVSEALDLLSKKCNIQITHLGSNMTSMKVTDRISGSVIYDGSFEDTDGELNEELCVAAERLA